MKSKDHKQCSKEILYCFIGMNIANSPMPHPRPNMTDNATSIKSSFRTNFI